MLISSLTGLDLTKHENMLLFACTENTESKPVELEASFNNLFVEESTIRQKDQ